MSVNLPDSLETLLKDEFTSLCTAFDRTALQESWSWRATHIARELANALIDDKGEIAQHTLLKAIQLLEATLYSLGSGGHHDGSRQRHLLKVLKGFYQDKQYTYSLKRIFKPFEHLGAEKLIKETLREPAKSVITDAHARRAALSALLCPLRQNVGSCFATAPAILIQQEQPLNFLSDIAQLFGTGRLTRVYEGVEYSVPLSLNWGVGELCRPVFLFSFGEEPFQLLASSPGLQSAFEAAGLIDKELSAQEKYLKCFELLTPMHSLFREEALFTAITPDQILRAVLSRFFHVAEKEILEYKESTIQRPFSELVIAQAPSMQSQKQLAWNRYLQAYEAAKAAFKSLTNNALCKAWEFTLASLSESNADLAKWNIYLSLGVDPEDSYGIGAALDQVLQEKIQQINSEISEVQSRYDHLFAQVKSLEGRVSRISTELEAKWMTQEYRMRRQEIDRLLSEGDALYEKGKRLQKLYPLLIDFYGQKIKEYFQEVYDAEMQNVTTNPYDDSPAGFKLMFKHRRTNTSLWTFVTSSAEYIQHLTSFFTSTENELNHLPQLKGLEKEVAELITAAIMTIKRPEFLESSLQRLAKAYHEPLIAHPLQNLDAVKRKPWSYISGGNMSTLISCYWGDTKKPQEKKRWVESEAELLAFLIDSVKELPFTNQNKYKADPDRSLLAFSPTHAFLCKPGWELFREAWESDLYTYSWIYDHWAAQHLKFLDGLLLDERMLERILDQFLLFIPSGYRFKIKEALKTFSLTMTPTEFRESVLHTLSYERWLQKLGKIELLVEELDSLLYRFLPLFPEEQLFEKLELIFDALEEVDESLQQRLLALLPQVKKELPTRGILTAEELRQSAKSLLALATGSTRSPIFFHKKITEVMQKRGLCYPAPLLFADTNWVKNVFGFVVNPGTRAIELWRFDECGGEGRPMTIWKPYLNGLSKKNWGLFLPYHYAN